MGGSGTDFEWAVGWWGGGVRGKWAICAFESVWSKGCIYLPDGVPKEREWGGGLI